MAEKANPPPLATSNSPQLDHLHFRLDELKKKKTRLEGMKEVDGHDLNEARERNRMGIAELEQAIKEFKN